MVQLAAGDIFLDESLEGLGRLRVCELDLLLKEGLIEKERESREAIYYKLSESAK